jgi:hypothetical protein
MSCNSFYILYLFNAPAYPRKQSKVGAINLWRQAKAASNHFQTRSGMIAGSATLGWNLRGDRPWKPTFPIRSAPTRAADDDALNLRSDLVFCLACMPSLEETLRR